MRRWGKALLKTLLVAGIVLGLFAYCLLHLGFGGWGKNDNPVAFMHYPTAAGLQSYVYELAALHSDLMQVEVIGYSLEGRPLLGVTIAASGQTPTATRPALLIVAQQHAREAIASQTVAFFVQDLLARYQDDPLVDYLLSTRTLYWLPQLNPDGNDYFLESNAKLRGNARVADLDGDGLDSEDGPDAAGIDSLERQFFHFTDSWLAESQGNVFSEGWARQTSGGDYLHLLGHRRDYVKRNGWSIRQLDNDQDGQVNEDGLLGVDLNRNWDADWDRGDARASSQLFRGQDAFSEPETAAARDFILRHPNIVSGLDVHSGAELILMPWSKSEDETPDQAILDELAQNGSQLTGVPHTVASQGLYLATGTLKDWLYQQGILALAPEIYRGSQFRRVTRLWPSNWYLTVGSLAEQFNPPPAKIRETGKRWQQFLLFMLAALPDANISDLRLQDHELNFTCGNSGLVELAVEIELWLGDQAVASQHLPRLATHTETLRFPGMADGRYRLLVKSQPQIAIKPHAGFRKEISFTVAGGQLTALCEAPIPPDFRQRFYGMTAPLNPDETEVWHLR